MNTLPTTLTPALKSEGFEIFREQLRKDFDSAAISSEFCDQLSPDYERIVDFVESELKKTSAVSPGNLTNLLYRIDVQEYLAMDAAKEENIPFLKALAHLIVRRELQKVVLKMNYSKNGN